MVRIRGNVASSARKSIEFFQVYVPQLSANQLVLPPAFIDMVDESLPHEATLLDQAGKSWRVTIERERELGVSIKNGWQDFISHHSLEFGDFLIFNYDGNSNNFSVSIFGGNGLKKNSGLATNRFTIPVKEEPIAEPENPPNRSKPHRRGRDGSKKDSRIAINSSGIPVKEEADVEPDGRYSDPVLRKTKKARGSCQVKPSEISCVPVMKSEEELSRLREAGYVLPKNPYFERELPASCVYRMDIQKSFLKSHGIQLEPNVDLYDQNGRKWPMKVYSVDKRTSFSTGWSEFRESHNLGMNDSCLFEFILDSGNRCKEVHVQISSKRSKSQT